MSGYDEATLSRIEDAGLNASAPPQQRWLDGWLLRFSPGKAKRARCINALAPGRLAVAAKLALAAEVFREAGLPLVVRITPFTAPAQLDSELDGIGMTRFDDTRVMVADAAGAAAAAVLPDGLTVERAEHARFAEVVGTFRGSPADQRQAHAQRLAASPVPYEGWLLRRGPELLACAQFARESDCVGLYDVFTAEAARNQGLAGALCSHLLGIAVRQGASLAYLQVDAANAAARKVYSKLGFEDGYAYHYRSPDPAAG